MKTGAHFERCNVGSVEAHNERKPEYLANVKAAGLPLYFFHDLTPNNTHWVSSEFHGSCQSIFGQLQQLYQEKTGQMPQLKDRIRVNKKTGKETTIAGWSPIREACIPIKPETTIEDFGKVFEWLRQKGLEPIRLDLHKDEGYKDEDTGEIKMNYHAHLVVCWVNRETGKTAKLNAEDMSEFNQTVLPDALGMEAGEAKAISGKEHLTAAAQRKKAELDRLSRKETALKSEVATLEDEKKKLEQARIEKRKALDEENGNTIKAGFSKLFGGGKYAAIEDENKLLKAQNERIKAQFPVAVKKATESLQNQLTAEKASHKEHFDELVKLRNYNQKLVGDVDALARENNKLKNIMTKLVDLITDAAKALAKSFLPGNVPGNRFVENKLHELYRAYWDWSEVEGKKMHYEEKYHDFCVRDLASRIKIACISAFKGDNYKNLHAAQNWVDEVTEEHLAKYNRQKQGIDDKPRRGLHL